MITLLLVLLGYCLGSIPFAFMLSRVAGVDIRVAGSGNVGAANVLRTTGPRRASAVVALDIAKASFAVWIAQRLGTGVSTPAAVGIAAIVGHICPVWLGFKGGKGVAAACGVFLVLAPMAAVITLAIFLATVYLTRYISLGSIVASASLSPLVYLTGAPRASFVAAVVAGVLIVQRHHSNLVRLFAGTERRLGQRA